MARGSKTGGEMGDMTHGPDQLSEKHKNLARGGVVNDNDEDDKPAKKRARGGAVHRGKVPMMVEGKQPAHHRLDRPGRKRGGAVGADSTPMTTAHNLTSPIGMPKSMTTGTE